MNTPYQGHLPLVIASACGHTRIVEILLLNGAQVNLATRDWLIAASKGGSTDSVKVLLDHSAQLNLRSLCLNLHVLAQPDMLK